MWWGIACAAIILVVIGRHRWRAAEAWQDVQAAQEQIALLSIRMDRAKSEIDGGEFRSPQSRETALRDYEQLSTRLDEIRVLSETLDGIYAARISPLGARLLSLPAPRG